MKLILFVTALLALVYSSKALQCYVCKSPMLLSSYTKFNFLSLCKDDLENSQKENVTDLDFVVCKKILEKVTTSGKQETLTIRTYEKRSEPLNLNKTIFEEYSCETDLCNAGSYTTPAWITLMLSIPVVISLNM